MDPVKQPQTPENKDVSPIAKDKTYGEKMYDTIFNTGINFWVNLLSSAYFSLWTAHTLKPIKLPFMKEAATPRTIQQNLASWVEKTPIITSMKEGHQAQKDRAFAMAETFTLLTPGHFIMIPSVWLGAKFKGTIVNYFDRKHYGEAAMDDPSLRYRHALVEAEAKPTLLGAMVGRLGTVAATQATARLVGTDHNFINKFGESAGIKTLEKSRGLNQVSGDIGNVLGDGIVKLAPGVTNRINQHFSEPRYGWSEAQKAQGLAVGPYNRAVQNFVKFTAMDTLYTMVTAGTIHPIMRLIRRVPGMTYTTRPPVDTRIIDDSGTITKVRAPRNPLVDAVPFGDLDREVPRTKVSDLTHQDRVRSQDHALQVS